MNKAWRAARGALLLAVLLTLLASWGWAAGTKAQLNTMPVLVQDGPIGVEAYNINDYNYFKLRDVAQSLKPTERTFDIQYNAQANAIYISTGQGYLSLGNELSPPQGETVKLAQESSAALYINGMRTSLSSYNIDGFTYYKLQDLGKALDFRVEYDNAQRRVLIECQPLEPEIPSLPENPGEEEPPVVKPPKTGPKVVLVDAGHGGNETGTENEEAGLNEGVVNWQVAQTLGQLLEQRGYIVVYTRKENETMSLTKRMELIRQLEPDLVMSVHHNATEQHTVTGAEVLAQVADKEGGPSKELAKLIGAEYVALGQTLRPIVFRYNSSKTGDYYGLLRAAAGVGVPAVISEFAFMDHPDDVAKIDTPEKLSAEAHAIFRAVDTFLGGPQRD